MKVRHYRRSIRLRGYDYSQGGYYFVTICTYKREYMFGDIVNGEMKLNIIGIMVDDGWLKIPEHFPNCQLDTYQIMPNHIHGIVVIDGVGARSPRPMNTGRGNPAPTLGQIVAYFKYRTTKMINQDRQSPGLRIWQRNFYEHIIRNEKDYWAIRQYIRENPRNWEKDVLNIQ